MSNRRDVHRFEKAVCQVKTDAATMMYCLKTGQIGANVTRDDMGTLHVNVSIALQRLAELQAALEEKYGFEK